MHMSVKRWNQAKDHESGTETYRVLHRIGSFFFSNRYFWRKNVIVRVKRLSLEEFYKKCHDVVMCAFFLLSS